MNGQETNQIMLSNMIGIMDGRNHTYKNYVAIQVESEGDSRLIWMEFINQVNGLPAVPFGKTVHFH